MENKDNLIICVGRQLGSGGRTIAKMLADDMKCKYYDRSLLNLAAKESGFCEKFFEENDEKKGFMETLCNVHVPFMSDGYFYNNKLSQESLFQFQSDAIRKAATESNCVFVGRCADYVLRDFHNVVSVFITADMEERIRRVVKRDGYTPEQAKKIIEERESRRSSYYNYYTGKTWGFSTTYDLCINSSLLGARATAEYIKEFIRLRLQKAVE